MSQSAPGLAGRMIAFEGVDGAGKSTAIKLVADRLRALGVKVFMPRIGKEHRSKPIRAIRSLTRDRTHLELRPMPELLLYAAREAQVLSQLAAPALARGETVLLDRSMLTPVVIGAHGRGLELARCEAATALASAGIEPDLTLIFDVEPRTSRIRKRLDKVRSQRLRDGGRKGLAGSGFKSRIRAGYLELAKRDDYPLICAERGTPAEVSAHVLAVIEAWGAGAARPTQAADAGRPWWRIDPQASFVDNFATLPEMLQLYFGRSLPIGRALRRELLEREPELVVWATQLEDPLHEAAAELAPGHVLVRLAGLSTPLVEGLRERCKDSHPAEVARSLKLVAGERADALRSELAETVPGSVLESLAGRSDPLANELRKRLWKGADAYERTASLRGCDDDAAWKLREKLFEKDPGVALSSLTGLGASAKLARVNELLERYAPLAPKPVLAALRGRSDAFAHGLRAGLESTGRELIDSLVGLDDPEAWALRERYFERWPSTVITSLDGLADHPRSRALVARCRAAASDDLFVQRRLHQLASSS